MAHSSEWKGNGISLGVELDRLRLLFSVPAERDLPAGLELVRVLLLSAGVLDLNKEKIQDSAARLEAAKLGISHRTLINRTSKMMLQMLITGIAFDKLIAAGAR